MASVIRDKIPGALALSVILDRARTYLLRARGHKQCAQRWASRLAREPSGYAKGRVDNHVYFAREHRMMARSLLIEAERIRLENLDKPPSAARHGARLLAGATFTFWPQYGREMLQFGGDLWLEDNDARRIPK